MPNLEFGIGNVGAGGSPDRVPLASMHRHTPPPNHINPQEFKYAPQPPRAGALLAVTTLTHLGSQEGAEAKIRTSALTITTAADSTTCYISEGSTQMSQACNDIDDRVEFVNPDGTDVAVAVPDAPGALELEALTITGEEIHLSVIRDEQGVVRAVAESDELAEHGGGGTGGHVYRRCIQPQQSHV